MYTESVKFLHWIGENEDHSASSLEKSVASARTTLYAVVLVQTMVVGLLKSSTMHSKSVK